MNFQRSPDQFGPYQEEFLEYPRDQRAQPYGNSNLFGNQAYAGDERIQGEGFEQNRHPNLRSPEVPLGPMDMGADFPPPGIPGRGDNQFLEGLPAYGHHYGYGLGGGGR